MSKTQPPRFTEYMRVRDLIPAPRNPNGHDDEAIAGSVDRHGYVEPPVIDERTGKMVAGHGRREDLLRREAAGEPPPDGILLDTDGAYLAPVLRGWASTDDTEAEAYLVASNIRPAWEGPEYLQLLQDIQQSPAGLTGTGEDATSLQDLLNQVSGFPTMPGAPDIPAPQPVRVEDLQPHPRNYQEHPEDQVGHIAEAISQLSFYKNLVAARDFTILAGHGAWRAAQLLGIETLPVVRLDLDPNDPAALKVIAADNELNRFVERDDRTLADLLREVRETDTFGLEGTGYDEMILANLLMVTRSAREIADHDAAAEWIGLPDYEPAPTTIRLIINFQDISTRERFVEEAFTEGHVSKRSSTGTWSGHWPKRDEPRESRDYAWENVYPDEEGTIDVREG